MSCGEIAELPGARLAGLRVQIAEFGLVRGYVCIAAGEQPLDFAKREDVHSAIAKCAANTPWWPAADSIYCHDAPGELAMLIAQFRGAP